VYARDEADRERGTAHPFDMPHQSATVEANSTWNLQWPHIEGEARDLGGGFAQ